MKYGRVFVAILYFIIFTIIAATAFKFAYIPGKTIDTSIPNNYYLQHITLFVPTLIFFIYLLRIKNNNLYWGILFLAIDVDTAIIILLNVISRTMLNGIFPISVTNIFIWVFGMVCVIGFTTLCFYFRNKYKSTIKIRAASTNTNSPTLS